MKVDVKSGQILPNFGVKNTSLLRAKLYTDCPATLDTLCEGYYSAVGGPTGQFVVYSGRGRFAIFFEVLRTHLS